MLFLSESFSRDATDKGKRTPGKSLRAWNAVPSAHGCLSFVDVSHRADHEIRMNGTPYGVTWTPRTERCNADHSDFCYRLDYYYFLHVYGKYGRPIGLPLDSWLIRRRAEQKYPDIFATFFDRPGVSDRPRLILFIPSHFIPPWILQTKNNARFYSTYAYNTL